MTATGVLTILLFLAALAACIAVIWFSREAVLAARSARRLSDDVNDRLIPLIEKADVTVDALNAELLRIDTAITRFEEAGERVGAVTSAVGDIMQTPTDIATGVAERIRQRWKERRYENAERKAAESYVLTEVSTIPDREDADIDE